jgi:uncharacterized protein involved in response to NO
MLYRSTMHAHVTSQKAPSPVPALLSYGFRPFFLLGAAWAIAALAIVLAALALGAWPGDAPALGRWHGHEMLFGFVAAAVAGFLLTAVPTWTGTAPVRGAPLAALAALWLAGRAVMLPWLGLSASAWSLVAAAFFPALALAVGIPLVRTRNYRNLQFIAFLLLLALADALFLLGHSGRLETPAIDPLRLVVNLFTLMIAVVGGRIVPLFTRNALLARGVKAAITPLPWLDRASIAAVVAVLVGDLVLPNAPASGWLAALAAVLHAARLGRWRGPATLSMPIVWILHVGYAWLPIAFALKAVWLLSAAPWAVNWLHAFTAGAFGTMVLGVMTRVALGHTGRPLVVSKVITAAYLLLIVGAALRIAAPMALPAYYIELMSAALAAWAGAFAVFLAVYVPILVAPRPDAAAARVSA